MFDWFLPLHELQEGLHYIGPLLESQCPVEAWERQMLLIMSFTEQLLYAQCWLHLTAYVQVSQDRNYLHFIEKLKFSTEKLLESKD